MVLKARALYNCEAGDHQELSFKENAIIVDIVQAVDEGWLEGALEGSKFRGLFPENYVELFEEEEKQPKLPPKPPPRKTLGNSNGVKTNSTPKKLSNDSVNNSDTSETPLSEPKKLSASKFAIFEKLNNDDNVNPSPRSPPIIKPKPKLKPIPPINNEISSNSDDQDHEVITPSISVGKMKSMLERNAKESTPLPSQTPIKSSTPSKLTSAPPPIAPKPGKLAPPLPSRPTSMASETEKKPPLPPRKKTTPPSSNEVPPQTPPRPSPNITQSNSYVDRATTKARTGVQEVADEAAKQSVSIGVVKLKDDLNRSKYGKYGSKNQDALFNKVENHAQGVAGNLAKKKAGETFDKKTNDIQNKSTSKPPLPDRKSILSDIDNKISPTSRPPLPARNTDVKIPRRPTSHNNPFSENDLSKGIMPNVKKRYEIIFDANNDDDDDDYIDGAVVKEIYLRSRLDNKTLFKIWNLLDTDEDGRLSRNEFCAGMFLIDERLKGHPVPDELPYELLE